MEGPAWSRIATWRAPTRRCTRTSGATRMGSASCSGSSRSRAACRATWHPKPPARFTRVASSGTPSSTPTERPSTTPGSGVLRRRGRRGAKRARSPPAGTRTSSSNPARDGAVLPILHLNGYKIANPTMLARIPGEELTSLLEGYGYNPHFVEGDDPAAMHSGWPRLSTSASDDIRAIQAARARERERRERPAVAHDRAAQPEGLDRAEGGRWQEGRGSGVPPSADRERPRQPRAPAPAGIVDAQLPAARSCSTRRGRLRRELAALAPAGERRMGANPHANGGSAAPRTRASGLPRRTPWTCTARVRTSRGDAGPGRLSARCHAPERRASNFRLFGPDETASNRLDEVFEATDRVWNADAIRHRRPPLTGRPRDGGAVSEHLCQGWLEGYLLTGRHGLFSCYEAFIHIVDSMFNQHAKWLKVTRAHPLAAADRVAELPADLARLAAGPQRVQPSGPRLHRPRGEQEGRHGAGVSAARRELPALGGRPLPAQPQLHERDRGGKQPALEWLPMEEAVGHCTRGASASGTGPATTGTSEPDVVMACAGDVPTLETLAASALLREHLPDLKIRVVNVVDLMTLQPEDRASPRAVRRGLRRAVHPDRPVIFAYHGYPTSSTG